MNDHGARGGTGMRPLTRIGLFALILAAVFAAASFAGAAIDPSVEEPAEHDEDGGDGLPPRPGARRPVIPPRQRR